MQMFRTAIIAAAALLLGACSLSDKIQDEIDRIKNKFEEYQGDTDPRGERPFPVVYQSDEHVNSVVISSSCASNAKPAYVYFLTQADASAGYFPATRNLYSSPSAGVLKPFWDIRYTNAVSTYIDGTDGSHYPNHGLLTGLDARTGAQNITTGTELSKSDFSGIVAQSVCVNGKLAGGATLNLYDAPEQHLLYAGIVASFVYQIDIDEHVAPWYDNGGNLVLQASFSKGIYRNFTTDNYGGSIVYNVMLRNRRSGLHINYIIGLLAAGQAWQRELAGIRFDPTTNIVHVATVAKSDAWWSTVSLKSRSVTEIFATTDETATPGVWDHFFRVNISYNNLLAVLQELRKNPPPEVAGQDFGLDPQEWDVVLVGVQFELSDDRGKALLAGSFHGFEVFTTDLPI